MRVLVTCPQLEKPGGVANYFRVLRKYFSSDVHYLTFGTRQDEASLLKNILCFCKDNLAFMARLRRGRYDLVHLNPSLLPRALIRDGLRLLIAKSFGKKVIIFMHGWDHRWEGIIDRFFVNLFRLVYFRADAFIVLAEEFKSKLTEMGYCKPISVETTSVDDDLFDIADKSQVHSAVSDRASGFHILFLSRMEKDKGIYEAIEAYRILKDRHAEVSMAVAGSGPEHAYAMSYVFSRSIQDIEFCGYIEGTEKQKQYQKADVYILPTYGEGMPISVLEAMSYGLPVITRPVGGLRDFFEEGRMGFYTESVEPAVFSELLDRLYLDPELRSRIKAFNREYAKQRFAASRVAGRLEQIYREVLAA